MMKSIIKQALRKAHSEGRCAFIPFLTGGFPDEATCGDILFALADSGADVIEVGLPFSDPMADGPTIQYSSCKALENGTTPESVFRIMEKAKAKTSCPFVIMTYYNPVFRMGLEEFAKRARDSGADGVIVPDLPPEEADEWLDAAHRAGLDTIFLVAPTTPSERMAWIASLSKGFLYYVSMIGVTGAAFNLSDELVTGIAAAKSLSKTPVAVGFGISKPAEAHALGQVADGVIVGSAFIREIQSQTSPSAQAHAAAALAQSFRAALGRSNSSEVRK
ncbi:MAG: tryptophan synthase subunit alpha [Deltaproteobacteria bacterium]|nr:tryptophan synthase subunit alpha [Deltaproteobacteria bacterium]